MQYIKAPDFRYGWLYHGYEGVRDAYETGRGRIIMRAKTDIESGPQHDTIVVSELPYGLNKEELVKFIGQLAAEERITVSLT